jgi:F-type H+-transporting ATPase subunit b
MTMRSIAGTVLVLVALGVGGFASRPEAMAAEKSAAATAQGAAEEGGGSKKSAEALNPITFHGVNFQGDMAVWTAIVFLVVLGILWRFAWGPIAQGLAKREQEIASEIAEAHRGHEEAKQLLVDYEKKLAAAKDEVRGILEQGRRHAEEISRQMIERAKEDAAAERQRALGEIESATAGALKELAERSATLATDLAGKILRARLKPQDHARLVADAVAKFASGGNGKK